MLHPLFSLTLSLCLSLSPSLSISLFVCLSLSLSFSLSLSLFLSHSLLLSPTLCLSPHSMYAYNISHLSLPLSLYSIHPSQGRRTAALLAATPLAVKLTLTDPKEFKLETNDRGLAHRAQLEQVRLY